jgi:hypothetical protein
MSLSEPLFKPESLRNLAKDNGPEYAGRSRRALRWCADVIEAADAVVQESDQLRKDDEALIRQMLNFAELVKRGLEQGTVKAQPIIEIDDDAPDLVIKTLHGEATSAITAATARLEKAPCAPTP